MAVDRRVIHPHFPYLPINLDLRQRSIDVEALLDTGFDGYVALPPSVVPVGEVPDGYEIWRMADGSEVLTPWFQGTASIGNLDPMPVVVILLGDEPLVGPSLIGGYGVLLDHGWQVIVDP